VHCDPRHRLQVRHEGINEVSVERAREPPEGSPACHWVRIHEHAMHVWLPNLHCCEDESGANAICLRCVDKAMTDVKLNAEVVEIVLLVVEVVPVILLPLVVEEVPVVLLVSVAGLSPSIIAMCSFCWVGH